MNLTAGIGSVTWFATYAIYLSLSAFYIEETEGLPRTRMLQHYKKAVVVSSKIYLCFPLTITAGSLLAYHFDSCHLGTLLKMYVK